ncbi:hypothetical protein EPD60_04485 [Flaviaesturariibacter flavus]|uniref:Uncharacterized protein n=1 Tax=Flaviaesturariibacter flavus TaxID=2502780 RepID=A0A4R1BJE6_9BACT|nr:hypothetical protein [Flaviaesturariibacter flavus]TCJ17453.1 hypothetical protein EPD60_04485 [Flaviaesturariibacter flavus]
MRLTLFLSRIALICNVFFLLALGLRAGIPGGAQVVVSTIGVAGFVLAALFNPLVNAIYAILLMRRRLAATLPRWLVLANFICLLLQIQYILFLNGVFNS